mmetsp:Transcript_67813/g.175686  ORF Transcript_67813/g.175686 Transcript_67813/m.175686 type:complete len:225 (+) Transcript_67813:3-677(+)
MIDNIAKLHLCDEHPRSRDEPQSSVVRGLQHEVLCSLPIAVATTQQRVIAEVLFAGFVSDRLVAKHDDVRQRLAPVPSTENDQVRSNRRCCMAVALGWGHARVSVSHPIHVRRAQGHAIVARVLLLWLGLALDLVLQGVHDPRGCILEASGPTSEDDGIILGETERVAEAARGRGAVRSQPRVLHPGQVQNADVVEIAILHEVPALVLHADLVSLQAKATVDKK